MKIRNKRVSFSFFIKMSVLPAKESVERKRVKWALELLQIRVRYLSVEVVKCGKLYNRYKNDFLKSYTYTDWVNAV